MQKKIAVAGGDNAVAQPDRPTRLKDSKSLNVLFAAQVKIFMRSPRTRTLLFIRIRGP